MSQHTKGPWRGPVRPAFDTREIAEHWLYDLEIPTKED